MIPKSSSKAGRLSTSLCLFLAFVGAGASRAQETCPCPPPPPPPPLWTGSLGLSYLATSGNTDTESLGLAVAWARQPTPWGLEITALVNRAESGGVTTAERYFAGLRGKRAMSEAFELFAGLSHESNEFAGFDSRTLVEAGGIWKALTGPVHELAFDAGLTWTQEAPVVGEEFDYKGAVAGAAYAWKITGAATLRERLLYFPNFDTSDDWRWSSETSLEAAFAAAWALRVGFLYTHDNLPTPGFEKTDSATTVSLVWKR